MSNLLEILPGKLKELGSQFADRPLSDPDQPRKPVSLKVPTEEWSLFDSEVGSLKVDASAGIELSVVNAEEALELGINSLFIDLEEESGQPIAPLLRADGETVWVRIAFTAEAGADGDSQLGQIGISLAAEAHSRIALFLPGKPEETMETVLHRAAAR